MFLYVLKAYMHVNDFKDHFRRLHIIFNHMESYTKLPKSYSKVTFSAKNKYLTFCRRRLSRGQHPHKNQKNLFFCRRRPTRRPTTACWKRLLCSFPMRGRIAPRTWQFTFCWWPEPDVFYFFYTWLPRVFSLMNW